MRTAGKLPYTCMIAPFFHRWISRLFPGRAAAGTFPLPCRSYTVDDFGRLPLLLPERVALNLKAFCPGLISPFGPGAFISPPPVLPGVFIWVSPGRHRDDRSWRARIQPP